MEEAITSLVGPQQFYFETSLIDLVTVGVVVACVVMSNRYRRHTTKTKRHSLFQTGFVLIASAYLIKALTALLLHVSYTQTTALLAQPAVFGIVFFHHFLLLGGSYLIYAMYNVQSRRDYVLLFSLLALITWVSVDSTNVLHFTLFIILTLISATYLKHRKTNSFTKILSTGFLALAVSQLIFVFKHDTYFYVTGEILQLVGYLLILGTLIIIRAHGKKTITNRHHT